MVMGQDKQCYKFQQGKFKLGVRKNFLIMRVVKYWNTFPEGGMESQSLEVLKSRLNKDLGGIVFTCLEMTF